MEERDVFAHAARVSETFQERLASFAEHPLVGDVRGAGLIGAAEIVADKDTKAPFAAAKGAPALIVERAEHHGLIVRNIGDSIAFCPPLVITDAQVDELFTKFGRALDEAFTRLR
jgi:4-aminobutyrate--pyruvate transaminase